MLTASGSPRERRGKKSPASGPRQPFQCQLRHPEVHCGPDHSIFMLCDGSYIWEIKDFLVSQDRCADDVTPEGQVYPGKGEGSKEKKASNKSTRRRETQNLRLQRKAFELEIHEKICIRAAVDSAWNTWDSSQPGLTGVGNRTLERILVFYIEDLPHEQFVVRVRITLLKRLQ